MAFRILVSQPGIKSRLLAAEAPGPNHWSTREFLRSIFENKNLSSPNYLEFILVTISYKMKLAEGLLVA